MFAYLFDKIRRSMDGMQKMRGEMKLAMSTMMTTELKFQGMSKNCRTRRAKNTLKFNGVSTLT